MKRDVLAGTAPAKLQYENGQLRYQRDDNAEFTATVEFRETEPGLYWVSLNGRNYQVSRSSSGAVSVNGRSIDVEVFDPRDLRASSKTGSNGGRQQIVAPMPGKVVRVLVEVGAVVEEGQGLVVVEAMKMQNEMKSPKPGTVQEIRTRAEATVAAGEILLVIE